MQLAVIDPAPDPQLIAHLVRRQRRGLAVAAAAIMVCGLLIKFPVLDTVWAYWEDSYWFCLLAETLERGHYSLGGVPHARFFPGFPITLAAVDLATFHFFDLPKLAAWLVAVSGSLAVGLCLPLYRRWGLGDLGCGLAILAMLLCAPLQLYGALPLYESFFMLLVVSALWMEARGDRMAAALLAGLATVTKPEGCFLVLGLALAARTWRGRATLLMLGGVPVLPWLLRNWLVLGSPLQSEYGAIYKGFAASGHAISGLAYLRHYPTFMGLLVVLLAIPSLHLLVRKTSAFVFLTGSLALHLIWPGDLERYVLPHAPLVFYLFGATIDRIGKRVPRLCVIVVSVGLTLPFLMQYPDRILAELTRSSAYDQVAIRLERIGGRFSALGADHAALQMLGRHFAFSAWQDPGRPWVQFVDELVRKHGLRYHVVTNYFHIDERFDTLQGGVRRYPVPGGMELQYRAVALSVNAHAEYEPDWLGIRGNTVPSVHQAILYEVSVVPAPVVTGSSSATPATSLSPAAAIVRGP